MLKFIAILVILFLILFPIGSLAAPSRIRGDVNGDGLVNMGDIIYTERIILGISPYTIYADVNGDGVVDMGDAVTIERIILGLER